MLRSAKWINQRRGGKLETDVPKNHWEPYHCPERTRKLSYVSLQTTRESTIRRKERSWKGFMWMMKGRK